MTYVKRRRYCRWVTSPLRRMTQTLGERLDSLSLRIRSMLLKYVSICISISVGVFSIYSLYIPCDFTVIINIIDVGVRPWQFWNMHARQKYMWFSVLRIDANLERISPNAPERVFLNLKTQNYIEREIEWETHWFLATEVNVLSQNLCNFTQSQGNIVRIRTFVNENFATIWKIHESRKTRICKT